MTKKILLSLFILLLIPSVLSSLTASISNPRMVLYENITRGEILELQNSVTINNKNNFEVMIKMAPTGVWEDKIFVGEKEFVLQPDERKEVFYTIKLDEPGYYRGDILVNFNDPISSNDLSLAQDLVVIVSEENGNYQINLLKPMIGAVIAIIFLIILTIIVKRRRSKK